MPMLPSNRPMRLALLPAALLWMAACGTAPKPAATEPAKKAEAPKPPDESRRFPAANLTGSEVVADHLLGKAFMPGGTVAHYKKGKSEYDMFAVKMPSATDSAILLPDWNRALADSKLVASFGGYFGMDNGRPVFVFAKGAWIAGITGLPEKEADAQARLLAAQLD